MLTMLVEELVKAAWVWIAATILKRAWRWSVGDWTEAGSCKVRCCGRQAAANMRGLCLPCYSDAKKMVQAGKATWEGLVQMGLCDDLLSPFEQAFNKAQEKEVK